MAETFNEVKSRLLFEILMLLKAVDTPAPHAVKLNKMIKNLNVFLLNLYGKLREATNLPDVLSNNLIFEQFSFVEETLLMIDNEPSLPSFSFFYNLKSSVHIAYKNTVDLVDEMNRIKDCYPEEMYSWSKTNRFNTARI